MSHTFIPGYVGPEVVLPVTSVIAAIAGFFLMMGRTGVSFLVGMVKRQPVREDAENEAE
jgi:hypothetical protein